MTLDGWSLLGILAGAAAVWCPHPRDLRGVAQARVARRMSHECSDRDLADALLSSAQRIHETYRRQLRQLVHERTDAELDEFREHFASTRSDDLPPAAGLVTADIRIACNQEKRDRVAWTELDKEVGK